jgi:hypothetical protein
MESTMLNQIKALLAKKWKNEAATLEPGHHAVDEVLVIRVTGSVERKDDQLVAPTVSIPLLPTLALFWEKAGGFDPGDTSRDSKAVRRSGWFTA